MKKKNIAQEVERTMSSLDGMQRAEMHNFLFEKIKMRMSGEAALKNTGLSFSWKLAAAFILIIFLNVFTCWKYSHVGTIAAHDRTNMQYDDTYTYNTVYTY